MRLLSVLLTAFLLTIVKCETHTWWFETTWVNKNPDGTHERPVIGFNNTWPLPTLRAKKGDRIQLYLINGFNDRNTTLHFHGLFQEGSNQMDGPEMVTQCPIPAGETMLYNFTLTQHGTYWYHSHTAGQYGDGMRAPFIIEDDDFPYEYDEEVVLSIGDWYHETYDELLPSFLSVYNPTGAEPIPKNFLFNDTRNGSWVVEPNKTYYLRIVNLGGFVSQYLYMEDHEFEIVEVDGVYVEKNTTDLLYVTVAQRYGVLVHTKNSTDKNYAFMNKADDTMLDIIPSDLVLNSTNSITYNQSAPKPEEYKIDSLEPFDDFYLVPYNKTELFDDADYTITIDVIMNNLDNGINYAFFNNITWTKPKLPALVTVMSAGEHAENPLVYGTNTNSFVLQKDDVVDIVLNNHDTGTHPFHLHGHVFQLITRGPAVDDDEDPVPFNSSNHEPFPEYPMMRDTVYVRPQSNMVMRFIADNPGVWYFHCHIEWHLTQGLAIQLIEAPMEIQSNPSQNFTESYINACEKNGMKVAGNAAGNTVDYLDLSGQNIQAKDLPAGFTARGIVALVFSCVSAFLGMAVITWYGMSDIDDLEARIARDLDVQLEEEENAEQIIASSDSISSLLKRQ